MDAAVVKALLASDDLNMLQDNEMHYQAYYNDMPSDIPTEQQVQILKLLILINNRILQLQKLNEATPPEQIASTLGRIGRIWIAMGENEKAIGQFTKSLQIVPDEASTLKDLAKAYMKNGNNEQAIESQEKVIQILSSSSDNKDDTIAAYGELADLFDANGDFAKSLEILYKARDMLTEENTLLAAETYEKIGQVQEKLGKYKLAVEALTSAYNVYAEKRGKDDSKTQEIAYLLEMASQYV